MAASGSWRLPPSHNVTASTLEQTAGRPAFTVAMVVNSGYIPRTAMNRAFDVIT